MATDKPEAGSGGSVAEEKLGSGGPGLPTRKPKRSGKLEIDHGSASMKAYPVASMELWGVGGIGLAASVVFSSAAALITFSIETEKDLDLAKGVEPAVVAYWEAAQHFAFIAGTGLFVVGFALVGGGALYISHILHRTKFGK